MGLLHKWFQPKPIEKWSTEDQRIEHRKQRKRLSETLYIRAQALAAWLLATLVAVNAAALTMQSVSSDEAWPFIIGIVVAILSGFASWQEAQDRSGLHYAESLPDENLSEHGARLKSKWQWRGPVLAWTARLFNWASVLAFVLGCMIAL